MLTRERYGFEMDHPHVSLAALHCSCMLAHNSCRVCRKRILFLSPFILFRASQGGRTCRCPLCGQLGSFGHSLSKYHHRTPLSCNLGSPCVSSILDCTTCLVMLEAQAPVMVFQ